MKIKMLSKEEFRKKVINSSSLAFTLIEVLVVIAIIGILAGLSLVSYQGVQNKGRSKAITSEMNQLRAYAQIFYDDHGNKFIGFCISQELERIKGGIIGELQGNSFDCDEEEKAWASEVELPTGGFYCVDSLGVSKTREATKGVDTTSCE